MKRRIVLVAALLALAACGKKQMLTAAENEPLPPKPETAMTQPTPTQLLDPGTQARPQRFDELIIQSRELRSDRFDMPPPG